MKNKKTLLITILILLNLILGCNFYQPSSESSNNNASTSPENKDLTDKVIDKTVGEERIGVPECDELLDFFDEQTKSEDENYIVKATRAFYFNKIRESIRKDLEDNQDNPNKKQEMAKNCRDYKDQIDKYKTEEDSKKNSN